MKTIGIIGGMSWESTVTYYQIINKTIRNICGGLHSAKILMYSVDFDEIEKYQSSGLWNLCSKAMTDAALILEKGGADFIVIGANTMHKCVEDMEKHLSIPILHIADATIARLKEQEISKVILLGTKYTMCQDFYKSRIINSGIEVIIPEDYEVEMVNKIIYDELCKGIIREESREILTAITEKLAHKGGQGLILGCTELDLLIGEHDVSVPVFDTTAIHAQEAAFLSIKE
ncbi:MAG: aspartate/glutamate racemase family protein [Solobacterium sp.]|nr:aspartate/glutamate racemase family protein [Solobacterium sp.]